MGVFLSKISISYRKFFNLLSKGLMGVFGLYILYMGIMLINHQNPHAMHHSNETTQHDHKGMHERH
ncbi:hypothetical protein VN0443_14650 [Helicobacter pylori]|nr:hypothetical protein VN0443_14650 [Helicobacter pylori]